MPAPDKSLVCLTDIRMDYGSFRALSDLSFSVRPGEVHAVVGEHGAGKSTMGMIMSGMLRPSDGTIWYRGRSYASLGLTSALQLGIRMVYQQIHLNDHFTVAENIFFSDRLLGRFSWWRRRKQEEVAENLLKSYGFEIDPGSVVKGLSQSDRTVVSILKNLQSDPDLLILDEALEKLSAPSLNRILSVIAEHQKRGISIVFITHKIDDLYNFADRVTILRNGTSILTDDVENVDKMNLIRMTYTQVARENAAVNLSQEFYHMLKYNEAILQHLPVNLIVTDTQENIKMVNESCKRYFSLADRPYRDLPLSQLFQGNTSALSVIRQSLSEPGGRAFYQVQLPIGGKSRSTNIKTFQIFDGDYHIGNIIILEDITDFDQLQKQLILSEKLASVGMLAAGVAHEINNPLEIIYNYLSHIKYSYHSSALHDSIDHVRDEISSIAAIVSNLVSFSDAQAVNGEDVDINEIIDSMLKLIQHNAKYKHIHITFDADPGDIRAVANRHEIKQVILNLLRNSFEAMPDGGSISIATTVVEEGGTPYALILFRDTGPGIDDQNPNNIFLPFYSTKKEEANKMGLGLSVSYAIIEKYRGRISVQNRPEGGCEFTIRIPAAGPTAVVRTPERR